MADVMVTINRDGDPTPAHIQVEVGDIVTFFADGADVVMLVDPETIFGDDRYVISASTSLPLEVQSDASGDFHYTTAVVDLTVDDEAAVGAGDGEGGGSVGPGG